MKLDLYKPLESLGKIDDKVLNTKERKDKAEQPVSLSPTTTLTRPME
jgi:hypothetical protein